MPVIIDKVHAMTLNEHFDIEKKPLFHGRAKPLEKGDVIHPTPSKSMDGEHGSFVFATDRYTDALVYAAKTPRALFNFPIRHPVTNTIMDASLVAMADGRKELADINEEYGEGCVVKLHSERFRKISYQQGPYTIEPGEWVSESPEAVTEIVARFESFEEIMAQGLIVFAVDYDAVKLNAPMSEVVAFYGERGFSIHEEAGLLYTSNAKEREKGEKHLLTDQAKVMRLAQVLSHLNGINALKLHERGLLSCLNDKTSVGLKRLVKSQALSNTPY